MPVGQCMIFSCHLKKMPGVVFLQKCQPHLLITVEICSDILHGAGGNSFTQRYLVHHIRCVGNLVAQWALVCCRWVWQSPNGRHDRNIWVFVQLLEKQHDCANICLKKEQYEAHQLFLYVSQNMFLSFPSPTPTTNQYSRGCQLPVKNRTWYYRGISKRPVKIKGFREVLHSNFCCCQHFFGNSCLMWFVQTVSDWKSNTSHQYSFRNNWKGAWKSVAHSRTQTTTSV